MENLWAIILAAGESRRMGFPKMLLPFGEQTMIERVISNVCESNIKNILVVLGEENPKITEIIRNSPVMHCYNSDYKDGMLSSVKCGFKNIPANPDAILVFQGDQPFITSVSIDMVIEGWLSSEKGLVVPVFNHKRGHPLLIDRKYSGEIQKIDPATGLNSLLRKYPGDILEVETSEPGILKDFDTYEDYLKEINVTH
jgi:molybdenum cofactor cytidylyltransferase